MSRFPWLLSLVVLTALLAASTTATATSPLAGQLARIAHTVDGDTVDLTSGQRVRLVQIDTPEVYYSPECYGEQAFGSHEAAAAGRYARTPLPGAGDRHGRPVRSPPPICHPSS
jgi:endonuclease YncB( thermonuclease family)